MFLLVTWSLLLPPLWWPLFHWGQEERCRILQYFQQNLCQTNVTREEGCIKKISKNGQIILCNYIILFFCLWFHNKNEHLGLTLLTVFSSSLVLFVILKSASSLGCALLPPAVRIQAQQRGRPWWSVSPWWTLLDTLTITKKLLLLFVTWTIFKKSYLYGEIILTLL